MSCGIVGSVWVGIVAEDYLGVRGIVSVGQEFFDVLDVVDTAAKFVRGAEVVYSYQERFFASFCHFF